MLKNLKNVHPLDYQTTNLEEIEEIEVMKEINVPLKSVYDLVDSRLPDSADKPVALRKFQELRMQINAAIALNGIK